MRKIARASAVAVLFLTGCASMQVAKEVQSGRMALRLSDPKAAAQHFEQAGALNPNYITDFTTLQIGVWTYDGRAYYEAGNIDKALEALKRARQQHASDYVAALYLGLVMSQKNGRPEAAKQIEEGLTGLHEWLATLPSRIEEGRFWDPGKKLLKTMEQTLAMLQEKEIDWKQVRANTEWLGRMLDEEIEEVRKQKARERESDGKQNDGGGTAR